MPEFLEAVDSLLAHATTPRARDAVADREPGPGEVRLAGDGYIVPQDDAVHSVHSLISAVITERCAQRDAGGPRPMGLTATVAGRTIAGQDAAANLAVMQAAAIRALTLDVRIAAVRERVHARTGQWRFRAQPEWRELGLPRRTLGDLTDALLRRRLPMTADDLMALGRWLAAAPDLSGFDSGWYPLGGSAVALQRHAAGTPLANNLRRLFGYVVAELRSGHNTDLARDADRFGGVLADPTELPFSDGTPWSNAVGHELAHQRPAVRHAWIALFNHCRAARGSRPSRKWCSHATMLSAALPDGAAPEAMCRWVPLVRESAPPPLEQRLPADIVDTLKGLAWLVHDDTAPELAAAIGTLALTAYRRVRGHGLRAARLGHACLWSLGQRSTSARLQQLVRVREQVDSRAAQRTVRALIATMAARLAIPLEELDDWCIPTAELDADGSRTIAVGDSRARLSVTPRATVTVSWSTAAGAPRSRPSAAVRTHHAEVLRDITAEARELRRHVNNQRARLERLFLEPRQWMVARWRAVHLDHPLMQPLTAGLVWQFGTDDPCSGRWHDNRLVDATGAALSPAPDTPVALWHPLSDPPSDAASWSRDPAIEQPFAQIGRDTFRVTDGDGGHPDASTRFAGRLVDQRVFNRLCAARGWHHEARLRVDDHRPPAVRWLPAWNLRAELWVHGHGNTRSATHANGVFRHLRIDRLRFCPARSAVVLAHTGGRYRCPQGAACGAVALADVPPIVFSEIVRDVSLFVTQAPARD